MALRTRTIDGKIVEDVRNYIEQQNEHALRRFLDESRAADLADLIEHLKPNERIFIFNLLEPEGAGEVIEAVDDDVTEELEKLLPYPEDTAGGIMGLEFVAVKADVTLRDAIETIRDKKDEIENLYHIWVVDDFGRLVGLVSLKDLFPV